MKHAPSLTLALALAFSSSADAVSSYYNLPCEKQAEDVQLIATLRDEGKSEKQVQAYISRTFSAESAEVLSALVPEVFVGRSMSPSEWFRVAKSDCERRGKAPTSTILRTPMVPRGVVFGQAADSCRGLGRQLEHDRLELTQHEKQLADNEADLVASNESIGRLGEQASNAEIDAHNSRVDAFNSLNREYLDAASRYNRNTEAYNRDCGGKAAF